ncbi:5-dehydro-2-deoxygluconokinase [Thioclava sp. FR2]|uniref:5-dehydro-2-deoxygluconokinase n=1 Tax=Thioclava sp. FR2 TaxID=3445780 RepID=UPI003EB8419F
MTDQRMRITGSFLVLGRAGMDLYATPAGERIEDARGYVAHLGGSAANIAATLSRLGAQTALLSRVSDDAVGRFVLAELDRYGIDRRRVGQSAGGVRTSLAVVETRLEDCQSVIYRNQAADFCLSEGDVAGVDFSTFGTLVVTGTAFADPVSRKASFLALQRAREANLTTVMDVDYRPYSWGSNQEAQSVCLEAAGACDIVVGNDVEFGLLAGASEMGLGLARNLASDGRRVAVYKMGEKGAVTVGLGTEFSTGIYRTNALKPTGAGDAFLGGFLFGLSKDTSLRDAVLRGSAAAAIVVSRVGCAPASPSLAELEAFLAQQNAPN